MPTTIPADIANLIQKRPKTDDEYNLLRNYFSTILGTNYSDFVRAVHSVSEQIKMDIGIEEAFRFMKSALEVFERDGAAHFSPKLFLLYAISELCHECGDYKALRTYVYRYYFNAVSNVCINNVNRDMGFYSFRSISKYSLDDIANETISAAHPRMFNDPLDTLLDWWIAENIKKESPDFNTQFAIMLKKANEHLRVRCLIGDKQGGHTKDIEQLPVLMWSHYADSHKGFCIRYEFPDSLFQDFNINKKILKFIHPVSYDFPQITLNTVPGMKEGLFTKSREWSYENEMRFVCLDFSDGEERKKEYPTFGCRGAMKEIYLGVRCSDTGQRAVEKAIADKDVKLFKMQIDKDNPTKLLKYRIG